MSEYQWRVQKTWVGVEFQVHKPWVTPDYYSGQLVGVIRRSATVKQCGHFCSLDVRYLGKRRYAADAEARIYPFHSLALEVDELPRKLELVYLGWLEDHTTPVFLDERGLVVQIVGADADNTKLIQSHRLRVAWLDESYRNRMWETQGMLRVEELVAVDKRKREARKLVDVENARRWAEGHES